MAERSIFLLKGKSFSGDELKQMLADGVNERIWAIGNEKEVFVVLDEGNDNYKVLAKVDLKGEPREARGEGNAVPGPYNRGTWRTSCPSRQSPQLHPRR